MPFSNVSLKALFISYRTKNGLFKSAIVNNNTANVKQPAVTRGDIGKVGMESLDSARGL